MAIVTSAEIQRKFGAVRDAAQREPVTITSHGRESLVLVSIEEYHRLKALDTRQAFYAHELPDDLKGALDHSEPPEWTRKFDDEMN